MKPAPVPPFGLTLSPSIFKIAEFSVWVLSITELALPLETQCYVSIYIPGDLKFENVKFTG